MISCRDAAPPPGRGWASHVFGAFQCAVRGPTPFSGCLLVAVAYVEFYLLYTRSREIFLTMLLMSSNESRPFLVVFSSALPRPPSAAEPLTPPLGIPSRPAGRPGPQPGLAPGPVLLGDVPGFFRSYGTGRSGPGPARPGLRPGRGPGAG